MKSLLTSLFLLCAISVWSQECPANGCACAWYDDQFSDSVLIAPLIGTIQHNGTGDHRHSGIVASACSYVNGVLVDGQYHCIGSGGSSVTSHTVSGTGAVNPTYIGHYTAHHVTAQAGNGCFSSGYGDLTLYGTIAMSVTECAPGNVDPNCGGSSIIFDNNSSCSNSQYPTYHDGLGQYGSSDYHNVYAQPLICPDTWGSKASPIVIPLDGGGYDHAFTDFSAGDTVTFHITEDPHSAYPMSWIATGEHYGFLVLDRNFNGIIDSFREMFGNYTHQPLPPRIDGTSPYGHNAQTRHGYAPNGFAALAYFDEVRHGGNGNGVLDPGDDIWEQIRVWEDTCHCGDSTKGTLYKLSDLGITEFALNYVEENRHDRYGNNLLFKSYMAQKGAHVSIYDVFFRLQ